jgi:hypothetical protein
MQAEKQTDSTINGLGLEYDLPIVVGVLVGLGNIVWVRAD